jgi:hypothetical protein
MSKKGNFKKEYSNLAIFLSSKSLPPKKIIINLLKQHFSAMGPSLPFYTSAHFLPLPLQTMLDHVSE